MRPRNSGPTEPSALKPSELKPSELKPSGRHSTSLDSKGLRSRALRSRRLRSTLLIAAGLLTAGLVATEAMVADLPERLGFFSRFAGRAASNLQTEPILRVDPIYPAHLKQLNIEGVVTASYTIDVDGSVSEVSVTGSRYADFREAVKSAVEQWRFEPPRMNGAAVRVRRDVEVRFERPDCRMARIDRARNDSAHEGKPGGKSSQESPGEPVTGS